MDTSVAPRTVAIDIRVDRMRQFDLAFRNGYEVIPGSRCPHGRRLRRGVACEARLTHDEPVRVLSVNVGSPREIEWKGKIVRTSIFKWPVAGAVRIAQLNLDGDKQSDLKVHGGAEKAVYAYPSEHYAFWREVLGDAELTWGAFGENLTTEGLLESVVRIGDRFQVGSAQLVVTQPRLPCFKLGIRLGRKDVIDKFLRSERSGFYFSVVQEEWFPRAIQ